MRRDATPLGLLGRVGSPTQGSRYASLGGNPGLEIAAPLGLKIHLKCMTVSSYLLFYPSVKKKSVIDSLPRGTELWLVSIKSNRWAFPACIWVLP